MSNVIVNKEKIDLLANAISAKSGEALTLTLDEMVDAVDGIETGGGGITPTGNIDITSAGTTDVTNYATATVPQGEVVVETTHEYYTENNQLKWPYRGTALIESGDDYGTPGYIDDNTAVHSNWVTHNAIASGSSITPTESAQTIGGSRYIMQGAVTVNAIPSNYVGSGITQRTSSNLSASGATVTAPSGYYESNATKTIASGTEGTPTATKSAVSNHALTVTPSVTNSAGYISGGTHNGTAVSVSASELVSGNLPITQNGDNIDVTNYATVSVNVSGGGGSDVEVGFGEEELSSASSSIAFSGLTGEPTSFVAWATSDLATGASPYKVAMVVYDGTNVIGQTITNTNNAQVTYDSSSFSYTYNNGTLTISSTGAYFQPTIYLLDYTYGGTAGNIQTEDVQVGSGATSITFTNIDDEPIYWSSIFKSNFPTSSGYQRVIGLAHDDEGTYGFEMDSSAKYSTSHWSATYNNGSLTITSQGTNAGGYFHQPGYYQLTYAISGDQSLQTKTVTPTESTQNVTADTAQGYTALKKVVVNPIPSSYVQPTATKGATTYTPTTSNQTIASGTYLTGTQTISGDANLVAGNIKSGTTIFGVTGTYTGGGGGSFSVATTTWNNSTNTTTSHEFTGLSGTPKFAVLRCTSQLTRSSSNTYYYIADIVWNGTNAYGNYHLRSNGSFNNVASNATTKFTVTTGTNSITFTSGGTRGGAPGSFYNGTYELTYVY